ncbi:MAG TPA: DsbA family protein [Salegentibacter sp.]|nr:DsbA family protein [Salegentibacter sp.]
MKIVYVYDALCGWCYGFSPVITKFQEKYKDDLSFTVISGGMITGNRIGPIGEVAAYISSAYLDVEKATGIKFGTNFLNKTLKKGDAIFTSIPPAIALSVFKELNSTNSVQLAAQIQKAIYYDGMEPENFEEYGKIAAKFGLDPQAFLTKMKDPVFMSQVEADFQKSNALGVTGFPSVFLENNGTFYKIASGYVPFSVLENNFLTAKNI